VIVEIELSGKKRRVELAQRGERPRWSIDGRTLEADAVEVEHGIYSVLVDGKSFEVRVEAVGGELWVIVGARRWKAAIRDPREWNQNRSHAAESEGRQTVNAPMPGKIIRILVSVGDSVAAGQGLVVVEAMKMQNEIRSPKSGAVERLSVIEGQTVNAGEAIAVIG
jgi:biotin carboxyl carrier protein